jgi:hypothetical protein
LAISGALWTLRVTESTKEQLSVAGLQGEVPSRLAVAIMTARQVRNVLAPRGKADKKLVERWVNSRLGCNTGFCRV